MPRISSLSFPLRALPFRAVAALALALGCGSEDPTKPNEPEITERQCLIAAGAELPDSLPSIECRADFDAFASEPLDASIPGARSVKVVLDNHDNTLYFQNSKRFKIHYEFVSARLSGNGKPVVPSLKTFNETEYYLPSRRFVLGSLTFYEGPGFWTFELAPYDTADVKLLEKIYNAVKAHGFFGPALYFHPTSAALETHLPSLDKSVKVKTTQDLFAKIDYQPLNLASSIGRLRFVAAANLGLEYVGFRDVVVLDHVPNDISVVAGIITEQFQTPLSHINVLSQNRNTPNMGLRNAQKNPQLIALKDKWVRLTVGAGAFKIEEVTLEESDRWWAEHRPKGVTVTPADNSVTEIKDVNDIIDKTVPLKDAIKKAVLAYGGKATHYAAMAQADLVPMPTPSGFAIPVYYYTQFLAQNKFDTRLDALMKDESFRSDPKIREAHLQRIRDEMDEAPVDPAFEKMLMEKIDARYKGVALRFRSSSSAEDLDGFSGAGLYTSRTANPADPMKPYLRAVKKVWQSVWYFRGYEERDYRGVDQKAVGMAILVHPAFLEEEATGVALTANPFDPQGLQPGFFINVQPGEASVTLPEANVTADQFLYHFNMPGQPVVYLDHSNLVKPGATVLTPKQIHALGTALDKIHKFFMPIYGPTPANPNAWYGLEVDFKFDGPPGGEPALFIKQARPHPGRGK